MKILVTGAWQCTDSQLDELKGLGNEIVFMQNEKDELPVSPTEVEGVICNGLFLYHSIEQFVNLRYIQLTSAGFDRVPMDYIESHDIEIHNAKGVYSIPMAEFAICGVLQLYKQSKFFIENQKEHKWIKHRNLLELYGKNVCIVGCGSVGTECAIRFNAFGCNTYGVDLYPREDKEYSAIYSLDKLDDVIGSADIVVLTLPLTEETKQLFNRERLFKMKKDAILVNIARGGVVDAKALTESLNNHLGGAVLDVFEEEPLNENSPLWDKENVIITPHNSFVGENNNTRLWQVVINNMSKKRV